MLLWKLGSNQGARGIPNVVQNYIRPILIKSFFLTQGKTNCKINICRLLGKIWGNFSETSNTT